MSRSRRGAKKCSGFRGCVGGFADPFFPKRGGRAFNDVKSMFFLEAKRAISGNSSEIPEQIPGDRVGVLEDSVFRDGFSKNFDGNLEILHGKFLGAPERGVLTTRSRPPEGVISVKFCDFQEIKCVNSVRQVARNGGGVIVEASRKQGKSRAESTSAFWEFRGIRKIFRSNSRGPSGGFGEFRRFS